MGGAPWVSGVPALAALAVGAAVVLLGAAVVLLGRGARSTAAPRPGTLELAAPELELRSRYARAELTREEYREALVDVLKDRYVRGELELEAYEAQLARLLEPPPTPSRTEAA